MEGYAMSGFEWVPYAASAAASAASGAYASNQANSTSSGNAYMANMTNMFMQAQNQNYNSAEAAKGRDFNAEQASTQRSFTQGLQDDQQNYNAVEAEKARQFNWGGMVAQQEFNANEAYQTRNFNATEAQKNRDFQAGQSATAYQRAIADMKAAGLNPMLAYSQGGAQSGAGSSASAQAASSGAASGPAASSGMGSAASASGPTASTSGWAGASLPQVYKMDMLGNFMSSALDMKMKAAQIDNINAQSASLQAGTDVTKQSYAEQKYSFEDRMRQIQLNTSNLNIGHRMNVELEDVRKTMEKTQADLAAKRITETEARARAYNANARLDELGVPAAKNAAKWAETSGMTDNVLGTVGKAVGSAAGIASMGRGMRSTRGYSDTYYDRHGNETGGRSREYGD